MAKEASDEEEHVPSWNFEYEYDHIKDIIILTITDEAKKGKPKWQKKIDKTECGGKKVGAQYDEYMKIFEDETIMMRVEIEKVYKDVFEEPGDLTRAFRLNIL